MNTTVELIDELIDTYKGGGWRPGTYLLMDTDSECGFAGCLIGMASTIECWSKKSKPYGMVVIRNQEDKLARHADRESLVANKDKLPLTFNMMMEIAKDPDVQTYIRKCDDRTITPIRGAEAYNDNIREYKSLTDEQGLAEIIGLLERAKARLEEKETPQPAEPEPDKDDDEKAPEEEPDKEAEKEPTEGMLITA